MLSVFQKKIRFLPPHFYVIASSWSARIISAAAQLIVMAILIKYLGTLQYAVFAVLISLEGWFSLAQMGIGPSVQNFISESRAKDLPYFKWVRSASNVAMVLFISAATILLIFASSLQNNIFDHLSAQGAIVPSYILFIVGCLYFVIHVFGIAFRVFYAYGQGYKTQMIQALASILSVVCIVFLPKFMPNLDQQRRLFFCVIFYLMPQAFLTLISFLKIYISSKSEKISLNKDEKNAFLKRSGKFSFFSLQASCVLFVDYLVMSQTLALNEITTYNILAKYFSFVFFFYNAILMAIWPIFCEKIKNNHWNEVQSIILKYISLGVGIIIIATISLNFLGPILKNMFFKNESIILSSKSISLFGIYFIIRIWTDTFATFLQSLSHLKTLLIWVPLQAILSISVQYSLSKFYGMDGILMGLIIAFLLTVAWALPLEYLKIKKKHYFLGEPRGA